MRVSDGRDMRHDDSVRRGRRRRRHLAGGARTASSWFCWARRAAARPRSCASSAGSEQCRPAATSSSTANSSTTFRRALAACRHGIPGLWPLPALYGAPRISPFHCGPSGASDRRRLGKGRRGPRNCSALSVSLDRVPVRAHRRRAPARGAGARTGSRPTALLSTSRCRTSTPNARQRAWISSTSSSRSRTTDLCDPRPGRSDGHGRPDRGDRPPHAAAVGTSGEDLRRSSRIASSPTFVRHAADEPASSAGADRWASGRSTSFHSR